MDELGREKRKLSLLGNISNRWTPPILFLVIGFVSAHYFKTAPTLTLQCLLGINSIASTVSSFIISLLLLG